MAIEAEKLDVLLGVLRKHDVAEFNDGVLILKLNPKPKTALSSAPDLAASGPKRTPKEEADELLFYSAR